MTTIMEERDTQTGFKQDTPRSEKKIPVSTYFKHSNFFSRQQMHTKLKWK